MQSRAPTSWCRRRRAGQFWSAAVARRRSQKTFLVIENCNKITIHTVTSIWFEIWGSWIRLQKISNFPGKFRKISIFSDNFTQNIRFFRQMFEKFRFSRQKLVIYNYFLASISLQKSPLLNIRPVNEKL